MKRYFKKVISMFCIILTLSVVLNSINFAQAYSEMPPKGTTIQNPFDLAFEEEATNNIPYKGTAYYYRVVLQEPGRLNINYKTDVEGYPNWSMEIIDRSENLYASFWPDNKNGEMGIGLDRGEYYIKISNPMGNTYDNEGYTLKTQFSIGNYEMEINDTEAAATNIKFDTTYIGRLQGKELLDVDYYSFNVEEPGEVKVELSHDKIEGEEIIYGGWSLELKDEFGNLHGQFTAHQEMTSKSISAGLGKGKYYIEISGNSGYISNEDYRIKISKSEGNFEQEPNNQSATANNVKLNTSYIGRLSNYMDIDYYKFTLDAPMAITLRVQKDKFQYSDAMYWYMTLCNANLGEMYQMEIKGSDTLKVLNVKLQKGTYYIKVNSGDSGEVENKIYNLGVYETSDWVNHWGTESISAAMNKGWVDKTTTFRPNDAITRAEFIKIVNKAFGYSTPTTIKYTDVPKNAWFYNEVAIAAKAGYISTANSKFRPNDPISREEVAAIVTSIMKNKDSNLDKLSKYTDRHKVSSWAKESVEGAIEAGYMGSGSLQFRPLDNISRAEAVTTLSRIK